jgi:hypothetical protein
METRRERLYRIGNRAETRYQRRLDAYFVHGQSGLTFQADTLVTILTAARLNEPAEYRK